MMGSSYSPEEDQAMKLLKLLSDPAKAADKIAEYTKAKMEHNEALDALQKAQAEFQILHDNLTADHKAREDAIAKQAADLAKQQADFQQQVDDHNKVVDDRLATINAREAAIRDASLRQADYQTSLTQMHSNLQAERVEIEKREAAAAAREDAAKKTQEQANRLAVEHTAKIEALRKIVTPDLPPAPSAS